MSQKLKTIIEGSIKGDKACQRQLFDMYHSFVFSQCLKYVNDYQLAEEVVQDAWIMIFNGLSSYTEEGNFKAWIKTIAIRRAWKAINKIRPLIEMPSEEIHESNASENQVLDKMTCDEVLDLLQSLPTGPRTVFKMAIIDQLNHSEIAKILEITESTSRVHLTNARKMLKEKFEKLNKISSNGLKAI